MSADPTTFGQLLHDSLVEAAMTQSELARRLQRSPSAVTRWMLGKDRPDPQTVIAIGNVLRIDPHPLLEASGWIPEGYRLGAPVIPPDVARLLRLMPEGWQRSMDSWSEEREADFEKLLRFWISDPPQPKTEAAG